MMYIHAETHSGFCSVRFSPTAICSCCALAVSRLSDAFDRFTRATTELRDSIARFNFVDRARPANALWPGLPGMPEWFDRYRIPFVRPLVVQAVRRVQERFPVIQRRARKRRRMIQALA